MPLRRAEFQGVPAASFFSERLSLETLRSVTEDAFDPRTEIISTQINNEPLRENCILNAGILPVHLAEHLELGSNQNFVTVEFAGLQFNNR